MVSKKEHLSSASVLPLLLRWPGAQNFPHCNSSPHNIIYSCDAVRGWCWRQSHFPRHLPLQWIRIFKMLVLVNHSVSVQKDFSASHFSAFCVLLRIKLIFVWSPSQTRIKAGVKMGAVCYHGYFRLDHWGCWGALKYLTPSSGHNTHDDTISTLGNEWERCWCKRFV